MMLECTNYLAEAEHETHAFAMEWDPDPTVISSKASKHTVAASAKSLSYLPRLRTYITESREQIAELFPPADVTAGFGIESPINSVIWMQSVHKAWLEISERERGLVGRLKQQLNPAHRVILGLERDRFVNRKYKKVVALSNTVKNDIMRLYGVPEEDIVIIPNGFSPTEFSIEARNSNRERVRAQFGFTAQNKVLLFVANEMERKGFFPLVCAIDKLKNPDIHLLAVGKLNPQGYSAEIEKMDLKERVHFTGPSSTVGDFYSAADLFVLPTQYEAWGLVIVEAMACGLPVVTSRLAGASIAVKEGETGVLLDAPHHVDEIAGGIRAMLSDSCPKPEAISLSVQNYAWSRVLKGYEQVLKDAC